MGCSHHVFEIMLVKVFTTGKAFCTSRGSKISIFNRFQKYRPNVNSGVFARVSETLLFWNEAPIAERAPLNDVNLIASLEGYSNHILGMQQRKKK